MTSDNDITRYKKLADDIRPFWPEKAAEIDKAVIEAQSGQRESLKISVGVKYRLEKFDGDYVPGKPPIEVLEGEG